MLAAGAEVDRYVVEAPLGMDGRAEVYRMRHRTLGTLQTPKVPRRGGRGPSSRGGPGPGSATRTSSR